MLLNPAIHFLTNYDSASTTSRFARGTTTRFVSFVLLGVAVVFELPIFVLALVRLRILTAAQLRRTWRVGIFVMR